MPSILSTTEAVEELGDENLGDLFAGSSSVDDESFHAWTQQSMANAHPGADSIAIDSWNDVPDFDHENEDGRSTSTPEDARLWLSYQNHLSPTTVKIALSTSEALAFTFCEFLVVKPPSTCLNKGC